MNIKSMQRKMLKLFTLANLTLVCSAISSSSAADEYFDRYGLSPASPTIDLGVQPLGYPSGVISAVMQRDRILKKALEEVKQPLKTHAFLRGADMVGLLGAHKLEAGLLGDMPTILTASTGNVWVVGLVKQTSTAIVAKGDGQVAGLAGKRIAYVPFSSAHHTLLQGLASAGLNESQVKLTPLRIDEMPGALERADIDAFAAWEPAPTIALGNSDKNRIVFRGQSTDYFVIDRDFEKRQPEAARLLTAGFFRAIEWMRRSQTNLDRAARWVITDGEALSGKPMTISTSQIGAITRREILTVPSAPVILENPGAAPLANEYQFLAKLEKLPTGAKQENVISAFKYDGLARVLAETKKYQLRIFDYDD
jgi:ABC-type nitrate/sulfonate/bicarbonate transport system substrate-binding protein